MFEYWLQHFESDVPSNDDNADFDLFKKDYWYEVMLSGVEAPLRGKVVAALNAAKVHNRAELRIQFDFLVKTNGYLPQYPLQECMIVCVCVV